MSTPSAPAIPDNRHTHTGREIPTESYSDQPYIVQTDDGAWLCCVTTGAGHEGDGGQHVISRRSTDQGRTWSAPVDVEPASGPEASYAVMLKVPAGCAVSAGSPGTGTGGDGSATDHRSPVTDHQSFAPPAGRIYIFYNHNSDSVRELLCEDRKTVFKRVDSLGHYVFKYSDDHGRSWSAERYDVPVRLFACDRENVYAGTLCFFWNVGRPLILRDGTALLVLHKVGAMGEGFFAQSEGCFLHSDNLLTERDPARIRFATLPDGEIGLRTPPGGGRVAEEQSVVQLSDGTLYCVYRTVDGWPVCTYSPDGGHSWTPPAYKTYTPAGDRRVKHPRAANFVWRCANGQFLYWFHNHGGAVIRQLGGHSSRTNGLSETNDGSCYDDRNPVWLLAGCEVNTPAGRRLEWSEPEIVLYEDDPFIRMSYPDLIEEGGTSYLTETNKDVARVHPVAPALLEGLFNQWTRRDIARDGLLLELSAASAAMPAEVAMPVLPDFMTRDFTSLCFGRKDLRQGFSIEFAFRLESLRAGQVLLDSRTPTGKGTALQTTARGTVEIVLNDGRSESCWDCDPGVLTPGQPQHLMVTVDGGPRIITFVVNGHLCDGGEQRQFGWGRFSPNLFNVTGSHRLRIAPALAGSVTLLRLYGRALRTSEAVAAWRAGDPGTLKSVVLPDDRATP